MIIVGVVMLAYVLFGGMIATTWVQIVKAVLLLGGATLLAVLVLAKFGMNPLALFAEARRSTGRRCSRRAARARTRSRRSRSASRSCSARPACRTSSCASTPCRTRKAARTLGALRDRAHRLLLPDHVRSSASARRCSSAVTPIKAVDKRRQHGGAAARGAARRHAVPRLHRGGRVRDDPRGRRGPHARRAPRRSRTNLRDTSSSRARRPSRSRCGSRRSRRSIFGVARGRASASCSRARTSRSWSASPSRSRPARTSRALLLSIDLAALHDAGRGRVDARPARSRPR